jgi:HD-GYP domain-containing protein (c-di-GMP phosphodiesterase class II)
VNDTRALLNRIAEFRKRLENMPRLTGRNHVQSLQGEEQIVDPSCEELEPASRTQAILEQSVRHLDRSRDLCPPALSDRTRGLLADALGLVSRLKAVADDPLLAGPVTDDTADPLAVLYRETAAMAEAIVRYVQTFPEDASEQRRLCEGLEGMIDAARRKLELLAGALGRRRIETERIDILARFLLAIKDAEGVLDPSPVLDLADAILAEEPGRPLRFAAARPTDRQAYLGGLEFAAPARFVAAHSVNCACVLARIAHGDPSCRAQARELVVAGLLHDVGMVQMDPALLATPEPLDNQQRRVIETHPRMGAEWIVSRLPTLSGVAEVAANHHERADGSGYPAGLVDTQVSSLCRLVTLADVYSAMCAARPHRASIDPRAAMTDVMMLAEGGRLDRQAAAKLLTLGLHPAGTVVELADGTTAVVLAPRDPRQAVHAANPPAVAVLADEKGRALATPRFLDLTNANTGAVVRTLEPIERLQRLGRSYPEWI